MDLLEKKVAELAQAESEYRAIEEKVKVRREAVLTALRGARLSKYEGEAGTVSIGVRKTVKVTDEDEIMAWIKAKNIVRYLETGFTSEFRDDVKKGLVQAPGVEVIEAEYLIAKV